MQRKENIEESARLLGADQLTEVRQELADPAIYMLPPEMISLILTYLPVKDYSRFAQTNRFFRAITEHTICEIDKPIITYSTDDADRIIKVTRQAKIRGSYAAIRDELTKTQRLKSVEAEIDSRCCINNDMSTIDCEATACIMNFALSSGGAAAAEAALFNAAGGLSTGAMFATSGLFCGTFCLLGSTTIWACKTINTHSRQQRDTVKNLLESDEIGPNVRLVMNDDEEPVTELVQNNPPAQQQPPYIYHAPMMYGMYGW